jgi:hypothetical protein
MAQTAEKRWYIRGDIDDWRARDLWLFDNQTATRMFVTNPENGPGSFFKAEPGEDFLACLRRHTPSWLEATAPGFYSMVLGPGEYHPRIARPLALATLELRRELWSPPGVLGEKTYMASATGQLVSLKRKLETICQTVQPSEKTLDLVYGHEIRNLLILAATEVEMHWRGILIANGVSAPRNTNEYVKLVDPLKLSDFAITFHDFPDLQPVQPFAGWSKLDPTQTLRWYAAYHGVKHNRGDEFERGTLRRVFEAVAACIVLVIAQFGRVALKAELSSFVDVTLPTWSTSEMYLSLAMPGDNWTPVLAFN